MSTPAQSVPPHPDEPAIPSLHVVDWIVITVAAATSLFLSADYYTPAGADGSVRWVMFSTLLASIGLALRHHFRHRQRSSGWRWISRLILVSLCFSTTVFLLRLTRPVESHYGAPNDLLHRVVNSTGAVPAAVIAVISAVTVSVSPVARRSAALWVSLVLTAVVAGSMAS